jgi:hypothetical protein
VLLFLRYGTRVYTQDRPRAPHRACDVRQLGFQIKSNWYSTVVYTPIGNRHEAGHIVALCGAVRLQYCTPLFADDTTTILTTTSTVQYPQVPAMLSSKCLEKISRSLRSPSVPGYGIYTRPTRTTTAQGWGGRRKGQRSCSTDTQHYSCTGSMGSSILSLPRPAPLRCLHMQ